MPPRKVTPSAKAAAEQDPHSSESEPEVKKKRRPRKATTAVKKTTAKKKTTPRGRATKKEKNLDTDVETDENDDLEVTENLPAMDIEYVYWLWDLSLVTEKCT